MVDSFGIQDVEITDVATGSAPSLQNVLSPIVDRQNLSQLGEYLHLAGMDADVRRIRELRCRETDHSWMFSINTFYGPVLPADEYATAVRIKLGANLIDDDIVCAQCGKRLLDAQCYHAQCCSTAEATIGHNRVRDALHAGFVISDPGANTEALGVVESQPDCVQQIF